MEELGSGLRLSRKGQRELSEFFAQELLYDYLSGRLDEERKSAVDETIRGHRQLQKNLDQISSAMKYARALNETKISLKALEAIDQPETYLSVLMKKTNYERWPLAVRWGAEAALVLCGLILFLIIVPWDQALKIGLSSRGREIILAEVPHKNLIDQARLKDQPAGVIAKDDFDDEIDAKAKPAKVAATAAVPVTATPGPSAAAVPTATPPAPPKPAAPPVEAKAPTPVKIAAPVPAPAPTKVANAGKVATEEKTEEADTGSSSKKVEGFLYRGKLSVSNLSATSPKIREKILEMGGRKAGEVDLGWKKTPTSSYFHFTLPEAKYDDLMVFLKEYGKTSLAKERHPRVMPDGIIRLIITVEEANNGSSQE